MPHFVGIGFYDLASFYASYIGKHKKGLIDSPGPLHHKVRVLELMNDREESGVFKEWRAAQSLLHKVATRLKALPNPAEVQHAYIRAFEPGAFAGYEHEDIIDADRFMRVHVLLNPALSFRLTSSWEVFNPAPWMAYAVDHKTFCSATNFDAPNTAHELVLELALDVGG